MKKIFWVSVAFSVLLVSSFTFANDASLSCTTVQEWKIDTSSRMAMWWEWTESYLSWFDITKFIKNEELLSSNGYLILDRASDEEGCNEYSLWKIKTFCDWEWSAQAKLDNISLQKVPYAYNPDTNKVYYIEEKIDDESVFKYTWTWSLKECSLLNNGIKSTDKWLEKKENTVNNNQKIESNNVEDNIIKVNTVSKKDYKKFNNMPLFQLVEYFGFNWKKDRKNIAQEFGIKNYKGTTKQNMFIKRNLMSQLSIK